MTWIIIIACAVAVVIVGVWGGPGGKDDTL